MAMFQISFVAGVKSTIDVIRCIYPVHAKADKNCIFYFFFNMVTFAIGKSIASTYRS